MGDAIGPPGCRSQNTDSRCLADDVAVALARLRVAAPSLDRETYTADELLDEVVGPADELRAVMAHKRRTH